MKTIGTLIIGALLFSCGNNSENQDTTSTVDSSAIPTVEVESAPNPHDLVLIGNKKWVIDEGMRISIDSIEKRMDDFMNESQPDFGILADDLSRHTKTVISNCTMKGQAHDELHKWLLPFIDLRKELNDSISYDEGMAIAHELSNELVIFNTYFE